MNFTKFVIILQLISNTIQDEVNVKLLESFVNEFKVKHPSVINNDKRMNIDLTKLLFKKGHYCRSNSTSAGTERNLARNSLGSLENLGAKTRSLARTTARSQL